MGRSLFYTAPRPRGADSRCRLTLFGHSFVRRAGELYLRNEMPRFHESDDVQLSFIGEGGLTLSRILSAPDYYLSLIKLTDPHIIVIDVLSNTIAKRNYSCTALVFGMLRLLLQLNDKFPRCSFVVMPCVPRARRGLHVSRGDVDASTYAYRCIGVHHGLLERREYFPHHIYRNPERLEIISHHVALELRAHHLSRDGVHLKPSGQYMYLRTIVRTACNMFFVDYSEMDQPGRRAVSAPLAEVEPSPESSPRAESVEEPAPPAGENLWLRRDPPSPHPSSRG